MEKNRLLCGKPDQMIQNLTLPKEKYINDLISTNTEAEEVQKQLVLGTVSMYQIRKIPLLVDKVKHLMTNGKDSNVSKINKIALIKMIVFVVFS